MLINRKTQETLLVDGRDIRKKSFYEYFKGNIALYLMLIPGLIILILFKYVPMYGVLMAFQNFRPGKGVMGSDWVGFKHFIDFFNSPFFMRTLVNTLWLGLLSLLLVFPAPIILAISLNEVSNKRFKKITQTISYMPYFLSVVVIVGLLKDMTSMDGGVINEILVRLGMEKINFFAEPGWFRPLYIGSSIWQGIGYSSIIYLAAISNINPELYEAAKIDGAKRIQRIQYITLPCLAPTITTLFIFAVGGILGNDFQKILLMYSPLTYETADVISTYVYREGILGGSYSYSTAVGLFTSIISLVFILITNYVAKKTSENSLF